MIDWPRLISAFVTIFVVIDPLAVTPLFLTLTTGMNPARRRAAAFRAIAVAAGVLLIFGLAGETLLTASGISLNAFRIAGGALLFLIAVEMLFEKRTPRRSNQAEAADSDDDPAVFPIAVPLVAGPGAMASMVLLTSQHGGWPWVTSVIVVMLLVLAMTLAMFLLAAGVGHLLGKNGINVLTRLFGILLAALAVQIVLDGLQGYGLTPV